MYKQRIILALKITFAGGLLYWLYKSERIDFSLLVDDVTHPYQLAGLLLAILTIFPQSLRWQLLLGTQGLHFSYRRVTQWVWIGEFFALTLPGSAGTEISRGYYVLRNAPHARTAAVSTILFDRVIGITALLFLGVASAIVLYFDGRELPDSIFYLGLIIIGVFFGILAGGACIANNYLRQILLYFVPGKFAAIIDGLVLSFANSKKSLFLCFLYSVISHLFLLASFIVAAAILRIPMEWETTFFTVPFIIVANILPITPSGVGVGEMAASYMFANFNIVNGAAIMLLVRIWLILLQLIGGLIYILYREPKVS